MKWLKLAVVALAMAGCGPSLCPEHRDLSWGNSARRGERQETLEKQVLKQVSIDRTMKRTPRSDCVECDKLIARILESGQELPSPWPRW